MPKILMVELAITTQSLDLILKFAFSHTKPPVCYIITFEMNNL